MTNKFKNIRSVLNYLIQFGAAKGWNMYREIHAKAARPKLVKIPGLAQPVMLRHRSSDAEVFEQIFLNEEYRFSAKLHPDNIHYIMDCGANIGMSTLYFHLQFPQAKIVAVELEKENYELLAKNTAGVASITPVHAGVWNKNILLQKENILTNNWGFRAEEAIGNLDNTIKGISIAELMKQYHFPRIDILKIDIEGGELELLAENSEIFLPKIRFVVIEFHDWIKPFTTRTFFNAISGYKYFIFPKGENVFCELLHRNHYILLTRMCNF